MVVGERSKAVDMHASTFQQNSTIVPDDDDFNASATFQISVHHCRSYPLVLHTGRRPWRFHWRHCFYPWHSIPPEAFQLDLQASHRWSIIEKYFFDRCIGGFSGGCRTYNDRFLGLFYIYSLHPHSAIAFPDIYREHDGAVNPADHSQETHDADACGIDWLVTAPIS